MRRGSAYRRASAYDYGLWKRSNVRKQRPPKYSLMIDVRLRETSYCCVGPKRYHITDFSKGAMLVKGADQERTQRYDRWYPLLQEEIHLVATSDATIVAVGKVVS